MFSFAKLLKPALGLLAGLTLDVGGHRPGGRR